MSIRFNLLRVRTAALASVLLFPACEDPVAPDEPITDPLTTISAGGRHTCALTTSGEMYCWGRGSSGQLGNGAIADAHAPVAVRSDVSFTHVAAGAFHTCALSIEGVTYCWGALQENVGQLGIGSATPSSRPVRLDTERRFRDISAGLAHTCGITLENDAYCWGNNRYGQLGDGSTVDRFVPVPVSGALKLRAISAGDLHTCAVTLDGAVHCWGTSLNGALGIGSAASCGSFATPCALPQPVALAGVESISTGASHTCAWNATETFCWGENANGQLGTADLEDRPAPVALDAAFAALDAGGGFGCGVADGRGYCWGSNRLGQVGVSTTVQGNGCASGWCEPAPTEVSGGLTWIMISSAMFHACGLTLEGIAYCWGRAESGELGVGSAVAGGCADTSAVCSSVPMRVSRQEFD